MKVIAGIVLYNANVYRLEENVKAALSQVDEIVFFDNGSKNIKEVEKMLKSLGTFNIIKSNINHGIAYALNRISEFAINRGYNWLLTLDQDSVLIDGLIAEYKKYFSIPDCGQLACVNVDRNLKNPKDPKDHDQTKIFEVKECMTSGTIVNLHALKIAGGYNEKLFIDWVDTEMCYELRAHGYKTYQINFKGVLHELGHVGYHQFLTKKIPIYNYNYMRKFYYTRNSIYMSRRYPKNFDMKKIVFINLKNVVKTILYEKDKTKRVWSIFWGTYEGYKMKVNRKNFIFRNKYDQKK